MTPNAEELDAIVITGSLNGTFGSDRTGAETSVGRRELTRCPRFLDQQQILQD